MPLARDDYLMRLIQQVAATLRRLRELLSGGALPEETMRDANAAIGELLGPQRALMEMLDAKSASGLVGDYERLELWVALLRLQADAARMANSLVQAEKLDARANALELSRPAPPAK
ncbi:MAG: hypothetical protein ABI120_13185 [Gemmatimonadaceae bacterium]